MPTNDPTEDVWLAPWEPVSADHVAGLGRELRREVRRGHVLFGASARVIARRGDTDDLLFVIDGPPRSYAVVHLTFTGRREPPPCPWTVLHESWEAFVERGMKPDHEGWLARGCNVRYPPED